MNPTVIMITLFFTFSSAWLRIKRYRLSFPHMLLIFVMFYSFGALGSMVGAWFSDGSILGKRLYGLLLFGEILLLITPRLLRLKMGVLGDFISIPFLFVCFSCKIDCMIQGCCYGFTLYQLEMEQPVRFPSALFEMILYGILITVMYIFEKKGRARNTLWPFGLIWFGVIRYFVDFFRGSALEKKPFFFSMTAGRFCALIVLVVGLIHMYFAVKANLGKKPTFSEYARSLVGKDNE